MRPLLRERDGVERKYQNPVVYIWTPTYVSAARAYERLTPHGPELIVSEG